MAITANNEKLKGWAVSLGWADDGKWHSNNYYLKEIALAKGWADDGKEHLNNHYLKFILEAGDAGGGMLVGNVKAGSSFPTARPSGDALEAGDYVTPSSDATFPFTISGITFAAKSDRAVFNGTGWAYRGGSEVTRAEFSAEVQSRTEGDLLLNAALDDLAEDVDGKLGDAPKDGKTYGRKNGAWEEVKGGGGGTDDYDALKNKPKINGVELSGDKSAADLHLQENGLPSRLAKFGDFAWEAEYQSLDWKFANENLDAAAFRAGACSAWFHDGKMGANFDWRFDRENYAVVRFGDTIGVAGAISEWTDGEPSEKVKKLLPFYLQRGENSKGLKVATLVVKNEFGAENCEPSSLDETVSAIALPRLLLDRFSSALAACQWVRDHCKVVFPSAMLSAGEVAHYFVCDNSHSYALEFKSDGVKIAATKFLTNFYVDGVVFNADGKVYTNFTQDGTHSATKTNHIQSFGMGLERWNLLVDLFAAGFSDEEICEKLKYSQTYTKDAVAEFWHSEFTGRTSAGDFTVDTPCDDADFLAWLSLCKGAWTDRDRDDPKVDWTVFSCVFGDGEMSALIQNEVSEESFVGWRKWRILTDEQDAVTRAEFSAAVENLTTKDGQIEANLTAEIERAQSAEVANANAISAETSARETGDANLQNAVSAEAARAEAAEMALNSGKVSVAQGAGKANGILGTDASGNVEVIEGTTRDIITELTLMADLESSGTLCTFPVFLRETKVEDGRYLCEIDFSANVQNKNIAVSQKGEIYCTDYNIVGKLNVGYENIADAFLDHITISLNDGRQWVAGADCNSTSEREFVRFYIGKATDSAITSFQLNGHGRIETSSPLLSGGKAVVKENTIRAEGGGEPDEYVKSASISSDRNTLTLMKKDGSVVSFSRVENESLTFVPYTGFSLMQSNCRYLGGNIYDFSIVLSVTKAMTANSEALFVQYIQKDGKNVACAARALSACRSSDSVAAAAHIYPYGTQSQIWGSVVADTPVNAQIEISGTCLLESNSKK